MEIKSLSAVCGFQNGFAFKSKTFKNSGEPVIRITNIRNNAIDLSDAVFIDRADYDKDLSDFEVRFGDLLIAMSGATTGKIGVHITDEVALLNQRVGRFEPGDSLNKQYLFYYLTTKIEENLAISAGAAQPNLSTQQIKDFQIPLPLLSEQKQIVAILDQAFEAIDKAKANIERNIQNAQELFQSKLNEVFSQRGDGWEEKRLEDVTTLITKGSSPKWQGISYVVDGGILFVTSENVGRGEMLFDKKKHVEEDFNKIESKSILKEGDVLTNIVGASIGRTAVYNGSDGANINQAVCLIRCDESLVNLYLMNLLNSPFFLQILHDNEVNMARANLSLTFFRNLVIPIPGYDKQAEIISEINTLNECIKGFESMCRKKLDRMEELKKSILQKAFEGELTKNPVEDVELNLAAEPEVKYVGTYDSDD